MDVRREELISAYLDGEVNPAERQEAEQLLAADADARAWLEEMRGLRTKLRALPQHRLEPGFAQHVIQAAEQARAAGRSDATASSNAASSALQPVVSDADASGTASDSFPLPYERNMRRPLIWSALAIAAALLLMLYSGPEPNNTVAQKAATKPADGAAQVLGATNSPALSVERAKKLEQEKSGAPADAVDEAMPLEKAGEFDAVESAAPGAPAANAGPRKEQARPFEPGRKVDEAAEFAELPSDGTALFYLAMAETADRRELNRQLDNRLKNVNKRRSQRIPADEAQQDKFSDAQVNRARANVKLQRAQETATGLDMIYEVEGTRQEIAATLNELQAQPNAFQLVAVAPQVKANYGAALRGDYQVRSELSDGKRPATRDMVDALVTESSSAGKAGIAPARKAMAVRASQATNGAVDSDEAAGGGAAGDAGEGSSLAGRSVSQKSKDNLRPDEARRQPAGSRAFGGAGRGPIKNDRKVADLESGQPQSRPEPLADRPERLRDDGPFPAAPGAAATAESSPRQPSADDGAKRSELKQATPERDADDLAAIQPGPEADQTSAEPLRRILLVIRLSPDLANLPAASSAPTAIQGAESEAAGEAVDPDSLPPAGAAKGSK